MKFILSALGIVSALGSGKEETLKNALLGNTSGMKKLSSIIPGRETYFGKVDIPLSPISEVPYNTRANQLLLSVVQQIEPDLERIFSTYSKERVAVILGCSNSGIEETEDAVIRWLRNGTCPNDFDIRKSELGTPSLFLQKLLGTKGPCYSISTACSSSAKAIISARSLIQNDIADAVICGGVDPLCGLAMNGFNALESISFDLTNPFSKNRSGINLGEGAAIFIMEKGDSGIELLGAGEATDAYHLTAPHPEGLGAKDAILKALKDASISHSAIDYINLHGTGTIHNDAMESKVINDIFGEETAVASTKPLTGHLLGAAGALELGLSFLMLSELNPENRLIPHIFDGEVELPKLNFAKKGQTKKLNTIMSNSFAFGGSNVSLIISRC